MKPNGKRRKRVARARRRIVAYARKHGSITNAKAREIGGFAQAFFHLNRLAKAKLLKHVGFNEWVPRAQKPGRPRLDLF